MRQKEKELRTFISEVLLFHETAKKESLDEFLDLQLKSAEKMMKAAPSQKSTAEPKKTAEKTCKLMFKNIKPDSGALQKVTSKSDKPADNSEKLATLQSANKNFKNVVVMSKNVSNDLKRWMSKMPSDKVAIMKKTALQQLPIFKKEIGKSYMKFTTAFPNDDLMAKVSLLGFIAQVLQDIEKESQQ